MAELKSGRIRNWRTVTPRLATFWLEPAPGHRFPDYQPGQYMALRRDDCRLTRRESPTGTRFVPDLDAAGTPRLGPVTHCYSITSAPFETARTSEMQFYVVLEEDEEGRKGRLTEAIFDRPVDRIRYVDRIVGDFTLAKRTLESTSLLFVATGTGVAPFVSMLKHLDYTARLGRKGKNRYTLIYANRTRDELTFHEELKAIVDRQAFDFVYLPSVSRPRPQDSEDFRLGTGRANNILRLLLGLPSRESEVLEAVASQGEDRSVAEEALRGSVEAKLPGRDVREGLLGRIVPSETVILTCGNPRLMEDVHAVTSLRGFRFEKEEW